MVAFAAGLLSKLTTSTWRESLSEASFRGTKFYVSNSDAGVGRRTVVHQYPFREENYVEDMGIDSSEFTITAYVIANKSNNFNYFNDRDKLIRALKTEGSGELTHPYFGKQSQTVSLVGKARITESSAEGGICYFTMTFVRTGVNRYAEEGQDYVSSMDKQATKTQNSLVDSFGGKYLTNVIGPALSSLKTIVQKAYNAQRKILMAIQGGPRAMISTALGYTDSAAANLFDSTMANACSLAGNLVSSFNSFKNVGGIVGDIPDNLVSGICSNITTKREGGVTPSTTSQPNQIEQSLAISMVSQMIQMSSLRNEVNSTVVFSPTTASEGADQELLLNLIINLGLVATTQIATRTDFKSQDEAQWMMEQVNNAIDAQLNIIGDNANYSTYINYGIDTQDDDSFLAMQDLRRTFTTAMQGLAVNLPQIIDYNVKDGSMPALVLSYNKYKDINRESEIITRNQIKIPHPAFLPGGESIKILSF